MADPDVAAEHFAFSEVDLGDVASERASSTAGVDRRAWNWHTRRAGAGLPWRCSPGIEALPEGVAERQPANLVSVYAASSFLQPQGCTGYVASGELGEVIFLGRRGGATGGLVIEREAGCSLRQRR